MIPLDAQTLGLLSAVFVASVVECIEALTIVLAMGMTRSWRSAITGTLIALVALAAVVALAGIALQAYVSKAVLQLIIGTLLLVFGLQWLRKAILRASGLKSMHDEDAIFRKEQEAARAAGGEVVLGMDWFSFVVSFKGVLLEGLEVIFIVITFGLSAGTRTPHAILIASVGAAAAVVVVTIAGFIAKGPLSRVPENTLKFGVSVLLCTFGVFWSSEGLGAFTRSGQSIEWPGGDWALLFVLAAWVAVALICVAVFRRMSAKRPATATARSK